MTTIAEQLAALPEEPNFEFTECGLVIEELDHYWSKRLALYQRAVGEYLKSMAVPAKLLELDDGRLDELVKQRIDAEANLRLVHEKLKEEP
jgi:hypothetical protein